jgi:hypothetical protein
VRCVLQVFNGVRLSECLQPLHKSGVTDGAHIIMLRKRPQPPQAKVEPVPRPTLSDIEAAIRREAEGQGREVRPATVARGAASQLESRLEGLMLVCSSPVERSSTVPLLPGF